MVWKKEPVEDMPEDMVAFDFEGHDLACSVAQASAMHSIMEDYRGQIFVSLIYRRKVMGLGPPDDAATRQMIKDSQRIVCEVARGLTQDGRDAPLVNDKYKIDLFLAIHRKCIEIVEKGI